MAAGQAGDVSGHLLLLASVVGLQTKCRPSIKITLHGSGQQVLQDKASTECLDYSFKPAALSMPTPGVLVEVSFEAEGQEDLFQVDLSPSALAEAAGKHLQLPGKAGAALWITGAMTAGDPAAATGFSVSVQAESAASSLPAFVSIERAGEDGSGSVCLGCSLPARELDADGIAVFQPFVLTNSSKGPLVIAMHSLDGGSDSPSLLSLPLSRDPASGTLGLGGAGDDAPTPLQLTSQPCHLLPSASPQTPPKPGKAPAPPPAPAADSGKPPSPKDNAPPGRPPAPPGVSMGAPSSPAPSGALPKPAASGPDLARSGGPKAGVAPPPGTSATPSPLGGVTPNRAAVPKPGAPAAPGARTQRSATVPAKSQTQVPEPGPSASVTPPPRPGFKRIGGRPKPITPDAVNGGGPGTPKAPAPAPTTASKPPQAPGSASKKATPEGGKVSRPAPPKGRSRRLSDAMGKFAPAAPSSSSSSAPEPAPAPASAPAPAPAPAIEGDVSEPVDAVAPSEPEAEVPAAPSPAPRPKKPRGSKMSPVAEGTEPQPEDGAEGAGADIPTLAQPPPGKAHPQLRPRTDEQGQRKPFWDPDAPAPEASATSAQQAAGAEPDTAAAGTAGAPADGTQSAPAGDAPGTNTPPSAAAPQTPAPHARGSDPSESAFTGPTATLALIAGSQGKSDAVLPATATREAAAHRAASLAAVSADALTALHGNLQRDASSLGSTTLVLGGSSWAKAPGQGSSPGSRLTFSSPPVHPLVQEGMQGGQTLWVPPDTANAAAHAGTPGPPNVPPPVAAATQDAAFLARADAEPEPASPWTAHAGTPRFPPPHGAGGGSPPEDGHSVDSTGSGGQPGENSNHVVDVAVVGAGLQGAGGTHFVPNPADPLQTAGQPRRQAQQQSHEPQLLGGGALLLEDKRQATPAHIVALTGSSGGPTERRLDWECALAHLQSRAGELEGLYKDLHSEGAGRAADQAAHAQTGGVPAGPGFPTVDPDADGRLFVPGLAPPYFPTRQWLADQGDAAKNPARAARLGRTGVPHLTREHLDLTEAGHDDGGGSTLGGQPVHPHVAEAGQGAFRCPRAGPPSPTPQQAEQLAQAASLRAARVLALEAEPAPESPTSAQPPPRHGADGDAGADPRVRDSPSAALDRVKPRRNMSPVSVRALALGRRGLAHSAPSSDQAWFSSTPAALQALLQRRTAEGQERSIAAAAVLLGSSGPHGPAEGHIRRTEGLEQLLAPPSPGAALALSVPKVQPGAISLALTHVLHAVWRTSVGVVRGDLNACADELQAAMAEMGAVEYDVAASVGRRLGENAELDSAAQDRGLHRPAHMGSAAVPAHGVIASDMTVSQLEHFAQEAGALLSEVRDEEDADEAVGTPAVARAVTALAGVLEREARSRIVAAVQAVNDTLRKLRLVRTGLDAKVHASREEADALQQRHDEVEAQLLHMRASLDSMRERSDADFSAALLGVAQQCLGLVPWDPQVAHLSPPGQGALTDGAVDQPPPPPGGASTQTGGEQEPAPAPSTLQMLGRMARAACEARQLPSASLAGKDAGVSETGLVPSVGDDADLLSRADPVLRVVVDWLTMPNTEFLRTSADRQAAALAAGEAEAANSCAAKYSAAIEQERQRRDATVQTLREEGRAAEASAAAAVQKPEASRTASRLHELEEDIEALSSQAAALRARIAAADARTAATKEACDDLLRLDIKKTAVRRLWQDCEHRLRAVRAQVSSAVRSSSEGLGMDTDLLAHFSLLLGVSNHDSRQKFLLSVLREAPFSKPFHRRLVEVQGEVSGIAKANADRLEAAALAVARARQEAEEARLAHQEQGMTSPTSKWRGTPLKYRVQALKTPLPASMLLFSPENGSGAPSVAGSDEASQDTSEGASSPRKADVLAVRRLRDRVRAAATKHIFDPDDGSSSGGSPPSAAQAALEVSPASPSVLSAVEASRAMRLQAAEHRRLLR